jgi:hypothetical protein
MSRAMSILRIEMAYNIGALHTDYLERFFFLPKLRFLTLLVSFAISISKKD